jgi:eukaryotic-like serine/threonine-protein kinase
MEANRILLDHVRLVRPLAEGNMGTVWVADHLRLETQVAVKFMSAELARDANMVARFTREAQAAARIHSAHVVRILDQGVTADHIPFFVMELLEGESLDDRLKRAGYVSPAETAVIVGHVCKALGRAHALGIVHRDIKPANIFLTDEDGELFVKLLDFGVAKEQVGGLEMTRTHDRMGTPYYMSPEQLISAKRLDYRADLWSLGVVAYHCLFGQPPFKADAFPGLVIAVAGGQFVLPSAYWPSAPKALDAWFQRVLVREPERRFETARQMGEEFARAIRP